MFSFAPIVAVDGIEPVDIIISLEPPRETIAGFAPGWQSPESGLLEQ
jgi:hypothetical protein